MASHRPELLWPRKLTILAVILLFPNQVVSGDDPTSGQITFNRDVRPILSDKCFACHGFDSKKRQADLRLDTADGAVADHDGRKAIVPGNLDASELWTRITSADPDVQMPPPHANKSLTASEKATIQQWILQGAGYQKHWSFEPLADHAVPPVGGTSIDNPIDAFILTKLHSLGLTPSPPADPHTLIRRVAFALTGLPPTPAETHEFLSDRSPEAYNRMVDHFLASPHYGEEMARHWLDVARYADTHGMHLDNERQTWAYRDWVIRAFNQNQPFDQFTIEQLAGDLLPNPSQDQLVATGFNRCNVTTSEGGSIDDELIFRYAVDRASTTMQAWMGLTAGCAVCHDHKFDPISQREFYSIYAFFHSSADPAMDGNALLTQPVLKLESPSSRHQLEQLDSKIASIEQKMDRAAGQISYEDPATHPSSAVTTENIWLDDEFPPGGKTVASPGDAPQFITSTQEFRTFSGERALKRTDKGLAQDVWQEATTPLTIPANGIVSVYIWIDPNAPPRAVMIQFHKQDWLHRAVWGDYQAIPWGKENTFERVAMGDLPEPGKWMRLEIPIAKVGLSAGDTITGFALTQFAGTVYWDKLGVSGLNDPAQDPSQSFLAWWSQLKGKDTPGLSSDINDLAKQGPPSNTAPNIDQSSPLLKKLLSHYVQNVCVLTQSQFAQDKAELAQLREARQALDQSIPSTFIFRDLPEPRESFVMMRGAYNKPGEKVMPNVPAVFPALEIPSDHTRATRLDLARWLVRNDNPLTARVIVNRYWQQVFGTGLVKTSYDFGSQGESPSHPELLDWLALHYRNSGWNTKELMRLLVTSSTFQQCSATTRELLKQDPHNREYARGPRPRLDAEQIRDNALFVSGLICLDMGGKGVKPYQPANIWEPVGFAGSNTRFYSADSGKSLYRRSIYTFLKRTAPPPFMSNFDAPNREQPCTQRDRSNTPLQALQLMNDVQHIEAARAFAERIISEGGLDSESRIQFAYRSLLSRDPSQDETSIIDAQLQKHLSRYRSDTDSARLLISQGESKPRSPANSSELAAYTLVANMLLNLDETLTRN